MGSSSQVGKQPLRHREQGPNMAQAGVRARLQQGHLPRLISMSTELSTMPLPSHWHTSWVPWEGPPQGWSSRPGKTDLLGQGQLCDRQSQLFFAVGAWGGTWLGASRQTGLYGASLSTGDSPEWHCLSFTPRQAQSAPQAHPGHTTPASSSCLALSGRGPSSDRTSPTP